MREYDIVFAPSAYEDLDEILEWLSDEAPEKVSEWYAAIKAHIQTLSHLPERCPFAPENGLWGNDELRQLLFQAYPSKYRIIFTVATSSVRILNIRHGARRYLHEQENEP
jgi:plasmid stabilization system protein ParE